MQRSSIRILLTRRWPRPVEDYLSKRFEVSLNDDDRPMDQAQLAAAMREFDILCPTVSDRIGVGVIETAGRRAAMIGNFGVGIDHIDVAVCRRVNIVVTNTPGVLTDATADLALTLMLTAARRAGEGERELRAGRWSGWRPTHLLGRELKGRTLGLVGFGRIAQATAARARFGFGMEIAYFARHRAPAEIEDRLGARFQPELENLVAEADILSLHVPGGGATRHMIDATMLARMKPDALLINTARGEVVDEVALAEALRTGTIAGAGLDVYANEPNVLPALLELDNVVLLPHLGSATAETREAMGMRVAANIEAWAAGRTPPDQVA